MQKFLSAAVEYTIKSTMVVDFRVLPWFLRPRLTVQSHCQYSDAAGPHPLANPSSTTSFLAQAADSKFGVTRTARSIPLAKRRFTQRALPNNIQDYLGRVIGQGVLL